VAMTNPMGLDRTERIVGALILVGAAYLVGHEVHKRPPRGGTSASSSTTPSSPLADHSPEQPSDRNKPQSEEKPKAGPVHIEGTGVVTPPPKLGLHVRGTGTVSPSRLPVIAVSNATVSRDASGRLDIALVLDNSGDAAIMGQLIPSGYLDGTKLDLNVMVPSETAFPAHQSVTIRLPDLSFPGDVNDQIWGGTRQLEIELEVHYGHSIYRYRGRLDGPRQGMNTLISKWEK